MIVCALYVIATRIFHMTQNRIALQYTPKGKRGGGGRINRKKQKNNSPLRNNASRIGSSKPGDL